MRAARPRSNSDSGAIDNRWLSSQAGAVDLDTALLRAFVATAEENHFGRAAGRLFVTQQALSKRIARLEEILGARLFERTNRRVELTAAGQRFLGPARDAVEAVDAAVAAAGVGGTGPVRVDVMEEHAAATGLVRLAVARDPSLRLEVTSRGDRSSAIAGLRGGDFDVAFGRAAAVPWPADVRRRLVLLEPAGLLVGAGHPWWSRAEVAVPELAGLPLRFPMHGAPDDWVTFVDELAGTFGLAVDQAGSNIGFDHFIDSTAAGPAVATFYGLSMRPPRDDSLRVVPIVAPTPVFAWAAMWRRRTPEATVNRLVGPAPAEIPEDAWLPAADRAWLVR
jgi:DNA-binding transcriptional LysR family regulator